MVSVLACDSALRLFYHAVTSLDAVVGQCKEECFFLMKSTPQDEGLATQRIAPHKNKTKEQKATLTLNRNKPQQTRTAIARGKRKDEHVTK